MCIAKSKILWATLPLASTVAFFSIPMFFARRDMWDSTVAQSGFIFDSLLGWKIITFQSGWEIGYFIVECIHGFSLFTGISYVFSNALFMSVCLAVISISTFLFCLNALKYSYKWAAIAGVIVPVVPVWNVALSSAMVSQIFYIMIGMAGLQLFLSGRRLLQVLGYIFCVISFELPTLILFLTAMSWAADLGGNKLKIFCSFRTVMLGLSGISYFAIQRIFNTPYGEYSNYNRFELYNIPLGLAGFGTYLLVPIYVFLFSALVSIGKLSGNKNSSKMMSWLAPYLILGLLFVTTFLPHLAVGKTTILWDVWDWNSRFTLVLSIPLAIITTRIMIDFSPRISNKFRKAWVVFLAIGFICLSSFSLATFAYKINQQVFSNQLVSTLRAEVKYLSPGKVILEGQGIPGPRYRSYEGNFLFQEAFGTPAWWVGINQSYPEPRWRLGSQYNFYEVYFPSAHPCNSELQIKVSGYSSVSDIFLNAFGADHGQKVIVSNIETDCN